MEREWVREVGHRDVPGKPALLATTREFLNYFGLKGLDELPTLAEIKDLDSINCELELEVDQEQAPAAAEGEPTAADSRDTESESDQEDTQPLGQSEQTSEPEQGSDQGEIDAAPEEQRPEVVGQAAAVDSRDTMTYDLEDTQPLAPPEESSEQQREREEEGTDVPHV
jgi:segregation and condensation protein B